MILINKFTLYLLLLFSITISVILASPSTFAQNGATEVTCADGTKAMATKSGPILSSVDIIRACGAHGVGTPTDSGSGENFDVTLNPAGDCDEESGDCITSNIQKAINILSIGVGIVVTIAIIVAGLQYMTARDNPQAVQAAKMKILNAIIALIAYVFIFAFLQWIVPGGLF